jgi:uncharacterized oxidoreductase
MSFLAKNKSCIVITGAESGIGLSMAKIFVSQGHQVIAVGKRQEKLDEAKSLCPQLITVFSDLSIENQRVALMQRITADFPQVNVLINNAAVNRFPAPITQATEQDWEVYKEEINTDLIAPIHLAILFLPHLVQKQNSLIVNVTCETAFVPVAIEPAYSASKAGMHSFTLSLRHQLRDTPVQVIEVIPPLVDTDMLPTRWKDRAISPDEFSKHAVQQLLEDKPEVGYKNEKIFRASRDELDALFNEWNNVHHA